MSPTTWAWTPVSGNAAKAASRQIATYSAIIPPPPKGLGLTGLGEVDAGASSAAMSVG
jgi:hypothetical protein